MTLTHVAECLAMELSIHVPVFSTHVCRGRNSNSQPSECEANGLIDCATAAVRILLNTLYTFLALFFLRFFFKTYRPTVIARVNIEIPREHQRRFSFQTGTVYWYCLFYFRTKSYFQSKQTNHHYVYVMSY